MFKNVTQLTMKIYNNEVVLGTIIVTIGVLLGSVFSYILQISLGRLLSVNDYGVFNALLALVVIFSIPTGALINSIIKITTKLSVEKRFDILTKLFIQLSFYLYLIGFAGFLIIRMLAPSLALYLNIEDVSLFTYWGIFFSFIFLNVVPSAYLQGLLRFKAFAFYTIVGSFLRAFIPLIFVYKGFGLIGIFIGISIASVLSFILSIFLLNKNFERFENVQLKPYYKDIVNFGVITLFIAVGMNFLNNVDIILVKHFFNSHDTGIYSSVVTIGKLFLFGASTVTVIMYPQISSLFSAEKDYSKRFNLFLSVQLALILFGLLLFHLFSSQITFLMFGEAFLPAVKYLPRFSIFVSFYIIINFLIMYNLAINRNIIWIFLIIAVIFQFLLITKYHSSLLDVINVNIYVSAFLTIVIAIYTYLTSKNFYVQRK